MLPLHVVAEHAQSSAQGRQCCQFHSTDRSAARGLMQSHHARLLYIALHCPHPQLCITQQLQFSISDRQHMCSGPDTRGKREPHRAQAQTLEAVANHLYVASHGLQLATLALATLHHQMPSGWVMTQHPRHQEVRPLDTYVAWHVITLASILTAVSRPP